MQSQQKLADIVQKILSCKSNDEIKQLEEKFNSMKKKDNDQFILDMLSVITEENQSKDLKVFAINEIRTSLSDYSKSTNPIILKNINQDTVIMLQSILINQLTYEQNQSLRKQISEAVGEIGASLINRNMWDGLIHLLWELFDQQKLEIQQSAFIILRVLIQYSHSAFQNNLKELNILLNNGLQHQDYSIKIEAIKTLGVLMQQLERKLCKNFNNLSIPLLESVYNILQQDKVTNQANGKLEDAEDNENVLSAINVIFDISDQEPSFFKNNFNEFYIGLTKMIQEYPKASIQRLLIESLVNFIQHFPEFIENQNDKIENILHLIFLQMVQVDTEITQEWMNPQSGYNDDLENDERSETIRFGQSLINQYIPCFEDSSIVLDLVILNIKKLFEEGNIKQDWRYPHAAMMALSQIGEFIEEVGTLELLLKLAYEYSFNHQNPLIRYAFCQIIGQISDDMAPLFQETYANDLLPKLIQLLSDNTPRVRAHSAAAIVNFAESMHEDAIKPFLENLLVGLFKLIDDGTIVEKEAAVVALSSVVESSKGYFEQHLASVLNRLFIHVKQSCHTGQLLQFCGNILECISITSHLMRKAAFTPYLEQFVEILNNYTDSLKNQPVQHYKNLFDAWNRLAHKYIEELSPLVNKIMPQLLILIGTILIDENHKESLDTENIQSAIKLISTFADKFSNYISPFIDQIYDLIQIQTSSKNETIRETACKCLPQLLRCVKTDQEKQKNFLKEIIKTLRDCIDSEYEAQLIIVQLQSMRLCIQEGSEFMSEMEFEFLSNQLMQVLQESDSRKQKFQEQIKDNDIDQIQKYIIPKEYKTEEQLHIEIAHVLGSLYKSHQEQALNFSASIYTNIIPKTFIDPSQVLLQQFGMILLQDIVKHIGFVRFYQKWEEIINVFMSQLSHESLIIKKESLYGLSCLVISTPSQILQPYLLQIQEIALSLIKESGVYIDNQTNQVVNNNQLHVFKQNRKNNILKEYAVDILGKLLKLHGSLLPDDVILTQLWIACLPIQIEKKIADDQHQIYLQYLIIRQSYIQNENKENILKIFQLLAEFYDPKICTSFMKPILDQFLLEFLENETIAELYNEIFSSLSKTYQKRLKNAIHSKKQDDSQQNQHNIPIHVLS
ncbi:hypothetical protein ABPG74_008658 [Tetrahymena malaccensis]